MGFVGESKAEAELERRQLFRVRIKKPRSKSDDLRIN